MESEPSEGEIKIFSYSGSASLIENAVFLAFWNRPSCLQKMLDQIRAVKPRVLLLYQNAIPEGLSEGQKKSFTESTAVANRFVNAIDWQCLVYFWRPIECADVWHSLSRAYSWAFSLYEKCIILEDDDLPSCTWFRFASTMLDKYQDDSKVALISSEVNFEISKKYSQKFDYIFSTYVSIHGWACWRKIIEKWDWNYSWLDSPEALSLIRSYYGGKRANKIINRAKKFREQKTPNFELFFAAYLGLNNAFSIIPTKNMLQNTGLIGTHSSNSSALTRKERRYFDKRIFEMSFPLKEPPYLFHDVYFDRKMGKAVRNDFGNKVERYLSLLFKGQLPSYIKKKNLHKNK